MRRISKGVTVGSTIIGAGAPISVQSMIKVRPHDIDAIVTQINELSNIGCEVVRLAVVDMKSARMLGEIKRQIPIPIVADVHFNYRLAVEALLQGIDKLRLNPGNIRQKEKVELIAKMAKERGVPIRIGVNSGSIDKKRFREVNADSLVESALAHIRILEDVSFDQIVISLKATDIMMTIEAYKKMAERVPYPFHIGITESGSSFSGTIKSAIGLGGLLTAGLGDTIRVSLTASSMEEVKVGREILKVLHLREFGPEIIACPTCGRTEIDLMRIVKEVEEQTSNISKHIKIAVMGCVVNGPGEASEADIGIAGGRKGGIIFKKGRIIQKVKEEYLVQSLMEELKRV